MRQSVTPIESATLLRMNPTLLVWECKWRFERVQIKIKLKCHTIGWVAFILFRFKFCFEILISWQKLSAYWKDSHRRLLTSIDKLFKLTGGCHVCHSVTTPIRIAPFWGEASDWSANQSSKADRESCAQAANFRATAVQFFPKIPYSA